MEFNYNIEGGNFSRAGTASSEVKKILKQQNLNILMKMKYQSLQKKKTQLSR